MKLKKMEVTSARRCRRRFQLSKHPQVRVSLRKPRSPAEFPAPPRRGKKQNPEYRCIPEKFHFTCISSPQGGTAQCQERRPSARNPSHRGK